MFSVTFLAFECAAVYSYLLLLFSNIINVYNDQSNMPIRGNITDIPMQKSAIKTYVGIIVTWKLGIPSEAEPVYSKEKKNVAVYIAKVKSMMMFQ